MIQVYRATNKSNGDDLMSLKLNKNLVCGPLPPPNIQAADNSLLFIIV